MESRQGGILRGLDERFVHALALAKKIRNNWGWVLEILDQFEQEIGLRKVMEVSGLKAQVIASPLCHIRSKNIFIST